MMNVTFAGYICLKCGFQRKVDLDVISIQRTEKRPEPIYSSGGMENSLIVQRACPECKNPEAFQAIIVTIGEHAGVNKDRSIIRYKCTKCFHVWIED
jgi:hypothetical protein